MTDARVVHEPWSIDEIELRIREIADRGEGASQLRALQLLRNAKAADVQLPEPLSDEQIVSRLGRLMRGVGPERTILAWKLAFPRREHIDSYVDDVRANAEHLSTDTLKEIERIQDLRGLYRVCPELR